MQIGICSCDQKASNPSGAGVMWYGEKGSILIGYSTSYKVFDISGKLLRHVKGDPVVTDVRSLSTPSQQLDAIHLRNFFDGIRTGAPILTAKTECGLLRWKGT